MKGNPVNRLPEHLLERGLPGSVDAEKFVLGSALLDGELMGALIANLVPDDFSLEKHRRIYLRMIELYNKGEHVDRLTVSQSLLQHNQLEACDGMGYIVSLDEGLPRTFSLDSYFRIIQDRALRRRLLLTCTAIEMDAIELPDDAEAIHAQAITRLMDLGKTISRNSQFADPVQIMESHPGGIAGFLDKSKHDWGVLTPFPSLNENLFGLQAGQNVVLMGLQGHGKSVMGLQIAGHAAYVLNHGVVYFTLEMIPDRVVDRLIISQAQVDSRKYRRGMLSREERARVMQFKELMVEKPWLKIELENTKTVPGIHAALRRLRNEMAIHLVVIDHVHLLQGVGRFSNDVGMWTAISNGLKSMALDLKIPFLNLAQPTKEPGKDRRIPTPYDLRESGAFANDADVILSVYRKGELDGHDPNEGREAVLKIWKNRDGEKDEIPMEFDGAYQVFRDQGQAARRGYGHEGAH